ncbi:hypothetical protein [Nocardioides zeae]|uniref:hypothetical protein n=1 Tax=Nocardioides zeae TaxID=1457234 RepID=UPI0027D926DC|nr:hypothetical protein [Nocardioides zeae]
MVSTGGVRGDESSFRARWHDDQESIHISVRPDGIDALPLEQRREALADLASTCSTALIAANDRHAVITDPPDPDYTLACGPAPTPRIDDVEVWLTDAPSIEHALAWIRTFATVLNAKGVRCTLSPSRWAGRSRPEPNGQMIPSAALCLKGWRIMDDTRRWGRYPNPGWVFDHELADRLLHSTLKWVVRDSPTPDTATVDIVVDGVGMFMPPTEAAWHLRRNLTNAKLMWFEQDTRSRNVRFDSIGRILAQAYEAHQPWTMTLAAVRSLLIDLHRDLELGVVRLAPNQTGKPGWALSSYAPLPEHLPRTRTIYSRWRHHDATKTFDAYGIQLLSDAHLAAAHDLTGWIITPLTGGMHLVEHPDPAAWFAHDEPDPHVLAQARHDFGPMIIDRRD